MPRGRELAAGQGKIPPRLGGAGTPDPGAAPPGRGSAIGGTGGMRGAVPADRALPGCGKGQEAARTPGERPGVHPRARILAVDDQRANLLVLQAFLERQGYAVTLARDGHEAIRLFELEQPDVVILDVMMPGLDGYDTCRALRSRGQGRFVPVVFLTALTDDESLRRCIDAGGDDFLSKPVRSNILAAKLDALLRIRELYGTVDAQRLALERHRVQQEAELEVAERIFSNIVHYGVLDSHPFRYVHSPMAVFNGDLLLAAETPSGGLRALVGDFTGHGLAAAVGAMPVADVFYGMTRKGFGIEDVAREINKKLRRVLPTGRFLAVGFVELDPGRTQVTVWNAGLPDVLIVASDGSGVRTRIPSEHLPLGALEKVDAERPPRECSCRAGDRIFVCSDGVLEAESTAGERFGMDRLLASLETGVPEQAFERVMSALKTFSAGRDQTDDLTLLEVLCDPARASAPRSGQAESPDRKALGQWGLTLELDPEAMRRTDPVPLLAPLVLETRGLAAHWDRIYMIVRELYSNALDHGVLGLDSSVRGSPDGFGRYYEAREQRLAALAEGRIVIRARHLGGEGDGLRGGRLHLEIEDSGAGFDHAARPAVREDPERLLGSNLGLSGRGIPLARSLCRSLRYLGRGNRVEAVYAWGEEASDAPGKGTGQDARPGQGGAEAAPGRHGTAGPGASTEPGGKGSFRPPEGPVRATPGSGRGASGDLVP